MAAPKKSSKKPRAPFAGVFAPFIKETRKVFRFLVSEFGFEQFDTSIVSYECSVRYRKDGRVAVAVFCEAGALPWVLLTGRYRPRPGRPYRVKEAAVDFVIDHRCPQRQIELPDDPFPVPHAAVSAVLRQYAAALRECAVDFLNGDPSVVVAVQPAVDVAYRQRLADDWREERAAVAAYKKKMRMKGKAKKKAPKS